MTNADDRLADDMVAEADTGARNPSSPWQAKLIIGTCIVWSLFQLYIASKLPGVLAQATGISLFANIVAQARFVHLAFAIALATMAFPLTKSSPRDRIPLVRLGASFPWRGGVPLPRGLPVRDRGQARALEQHGCRDVGDRDGGSDDRRLPLPRAAARDDCGVFHPLRLLRRLFGMGAQHHELRWRVAHQGTVAITGCRQRGSSASRWASRPP